MIKKLLILIFFITYSKTSFSNQVEVNKYLDGMFSYSSMVSYKSKDSFLLFGRHSGIVKLILNGVLVSENFIDLRDRALLGGENKGHSFEEGIQDIAFSNNYSNENRVYISYTDKFHNLTLSRFELSKNLLKGISGTEEVLLNVEKHRREHASGALDFSPIDNYLYIGIGDGDIGGNPSGTSQNKRALQGKILRIDVVKSKKEFSIPSENPFLNTDSRPELWAYGLRSLAKSGIVFDRLNGDLYIADTGWYHFEEINYQNYESKGGENYGWNNTEGYYCRNDFFNNKDDCLKKDFKWPIFAYSKYDGCSVIAGGVYRGKKNNWNGVFVFSDYCSGVIMGLKKIKNDWYYSELLKISINPHSIVRTYNNSFFVSDRYSGDIYNIVFKEFNINKWKKIDNKKIIGNLYTPNTEVAQILNSTSWKITKPLRTISNFFKKLVKR